MKKPTILINQNIRLHIAFFVLLLMLVLSILQANAQTAEPTLKAPAFSREKTGQQKYVHIIDFVNGKNIKSIRGRILKIDSQQIEFQGRSSSIHKISMYGIKSIRIHKRGAGKLGFGYGAIVGGIIGGIAAAASYEPPPPCTSCWIHFDDPYGKSSTFIGGSFVGILIGGTLGAIIGSQTYVKKFQINGDTIAFEKMRAGFIQFY